MQLKTLFISRVFCRFWNHASSMVKCKWKPSLPSLLLTENLKENPKFPRKIFSFNNDTCYQLSLSQTSGARCWGSSCRWHVTLNLSRDVHIFNPYTKARIQLPSQLTFPSHESPLDDPDEDAIFNRQISIRKAIVVKSTEKDNDNDLIVLAIHSNWKRYLAFTRPGDERWTPIVPPWPLTDVRYAAPIIHRAADVICRDQFILILYEDASIGCVDISDLSKSSNLQTSITAKKFIPCIEVLQDRLNKYLLEMYLVESFGDLLLVIRNKSSCEDPNTQLTQKTITKPPVLRYLRSILRTESGNRSRN